MESNSNINITFVREVRLRYRKPKPTNAFDAVLSPDKAAAFMRRLLPDNVREHFLALFLDSRRLVVGYLVAATGTADCCPVGARELFQAAVVVGAVGMVVGHSHISGSPIPSPEDGEVTARLHQAGALLGIPVFDHVIISYEAYYSFRQANRMPA